MTTTIKCSRQILEAALGDSLLPGYRIDRLISVQAERSGDIFEIALECAALPPGEVELEYGEYEGAGGKRVFIKNIRQVSIALDGKAS